LLSLFVFVALSRPRRFADCSFEWLFGKAWTGAALAAVTALMGIAVGGTALGLFVALLFVVSLPIVWKPSTEQTSPPNRLLQVLCDVALVTLFAVVSCFYGRSILVSAAGVIGYGLALSRSGPLSGERLMAVGFAATAAAASMGECTDPLAVVVPFVAGLVMAFCAHVGSRHGAPISETAVRLVQTIWPSGLAVFAPILPIPAAGVLGIWLGARQPRAETADEEEVRPRRGLILTFVMLAVVSRLIFWATTDRVWEDGLITLRHAENAARGFGMTHHPAHGNVHGFTSAVNVLIPWVGESIALGSGLLALRLSTLAAAAATVWIAGRLGDLLRLSTPSLAFWLAYLALEHSQISFGIAGMETPIWTLVLVWGMWAHAVGGPVMLGLAAAAAGYCRPDAVAWIGLLIGARLWKSPREGALAAVVAIIGFAPWVIWTTAYYGSPTPNTIRAKACYRGVIGSTPETSSALLFVARKTHDDWDAISRSLEPNFRGHGLDPVPIVPRVQNIAAVLTFLGAAGTVALLFGRFWIVPVYLAAYVFYLLGLVGWVFAWYVVPPAALAALLVAVGVDRTIAPTDDQWRHRLRWLASGLLITAYVAPLPVTFLSERQVQRIIEDRVRKPVGLWLKEHAKSGEYVTAECLGYFSYYSDLPFHDFPGLSSPRAVAVLAAEPRDRYLLPIVEQLRPEWVVIREFEDPKKVHGYKEVHRIGLNDADHRELRRYLRFPTIDSEFIILRRSDLPPLETPLNQR
jgi:hypothetical protein